MGALGVGTNLLAAALFAALGLAGVVAQGADAPQELREAHAVLLGLSGDGAVPEAEGSSDIYYSIVDNPEAPRLVTRLELAVIPCRSRTISALQFPGQWATLTLGLTDLTRITSVAAYASVDDMIAETGAISVDDPRARQVVLTGDGLHCVSRISLAGESTQEVCGDRLDLSLMDEEQRERGRRALETVADRCKVSVLKG